MEFRLHSMTLNTANSLSHWLTSAMHQPASNDEHARACVCVCGVRRIVNGKRWCPKEVGGIARHPKSWWTMMKYPAIILNPTVDRKGARVNTATSCWSRTQQPVCNEVYVRVNHCWILIYLFVSPDSTDLNLLGIKIINWHIFPNPLLQKYSPYLLQDLRL